MLLDMLTGQEYMALDDFAYKTLPKIGYIALLDKSPVAAGFLRKVEGNVVAQIDSLVSNPYFGSIVRHRGISMVIDQLTADAKELKLKGVYAFTIEPSVIERAESIGFHVLKHTLIAKPLVD